MTELLAPFGAPDAVEQPADVAEASPRTLVLITEQQVLFATAAASVASSNEARPKRRHYPRGNDFLEDSRMAREMLRL